MPFGVLREVFGSPQLRRIELSLAGFWAGDWASFVALSVYAYDRHGATGVGILGLVRMVAIAASLPVGSLLTDRHPRQRVLLAIHLARAASLGAAALVLALGGPTAAVFALAALTSFCGGPFRPAHLSLLPTLARSAHELVAANVASSTVEGLAVLIGPAVAGALLAVTSQATVVAVAALTFLWAALLVARLGPDTQWRPARRPPDWTPLSETAAGLRTLRADRRPRLVIGLFAAQTFVRGLMNVLLVAASIRLLGSGQSGVGFLHSALGAGGLVGGLAAAGLVGRRRLAGPFTKALVLWGAPLAAIVIMTRFWWAAACLVLVGIGNAILDVSGYTLIQRTVEDRVLGRVFGVFEILVSCGAAAGSIAAPLLLHELGIRHALLVTGAILPILAVLCRRRLQAIDRTVSVPEAELDLLRAIPVFSPLPATTLERLASRVEPVTAAAGTEVVREGETGDRFYVIAAGAIEVVDHGRHVETLGPGEYFGEIALLHEVPRTATCVAVSDADLLALDRDVFVAAVTGHRLSEEEAEDVVSARLAHLEELAAG
jgi:MFS family permease